MSEEAKGTSETRARDNGRAAKMNPDGRKVAAAAFEEIVYLRQAAAAMLRYLDGEVIDGLRSGRHTREVAANIAQHQSRNLRNAVERTGALTPDGYAGRGTHLQDNHPPELEMP